MFAFDLTSGKITLHAGDTGSVTYHVDGDTLSSNDRVLWTMINASGKVVKQYVLVPDGSNDVTARFTNSDTDNLGAGTYTYDMRVVVNPTYETIDGVQTITDGDAVATLTEPMKVVIKSTIGKI